eukprot:TRINITY_DN22535_c0_g1_i2.p1 TRINITY_DN22535_c0_g1~~TRINITY_DN22535_c0_g1_i2.p1  ORF type:complete len:504 (-),score=137.04 TRINITY_DN22535_c0_g1_i2:40-1551(-)
MCIRDRTETKEMINAGQQASSTLSVEPVKLISASQQTEGYSDLEINKEYLEALSLSHNNKCMECQSTITSAKMLKEQTLSRQANELIESAEMEPSNENATYTAEKSPQVSSFKQIPMALPVVKCNTEHELNECKYRLVEQEKVIASQNKLIEEFTVKNVQQGELKAKVQNYKSQIQELQYQLEKINEQLVENIKRSSYIGQHQTNLEALNKKLKDYEDIIEQLVADCNHHKSEYTSLIEKHRQLEAKASNPKVLNRLITTNQYLEHKLSSKNSETSMQIDSLVESPQQVFSWELLSKFIENVKEYVRRVRRHKEQRKELEETRSEFVRHVEEQLAELNKSWTLVKEREKENQEFMAQLVKREEEIMKKQHNEVYASKIYKSELKRAIEELMQEKEKVALEVENLKKKCEEIKREVGNSEVILNNCKRVIEIQTAEIESTKQEVQMLESKKHKIIEELKEWNEELDRKQSELSKAVVNIKDSKIQLSKLAVSYTHLTLPTICSV